MTLLLLPNNILSLAVLQQMSQSQASPRTSPSPAYSHTQSQDERSYHHMDPSYNINHHQLSPHATNFPFDVIMGNGAVGYVDREVVNRQLPPGYLNGGVYDTGEVMIEEFRQMAIRGGGGQGVGVAEPGTPMGMGGMGVCGEDAVGGMFTHHRNTPDAGYEADLSKCIMYTAQSQCLLVLYSGNFYFRTK